MKIFLTIQGVLYMIIVFSDIGNQMPANWSNGIKLFSVLVCFMYLLIAFRPRISGFDHLLMTGLIAMTFLADAMLLFSNQLALGVLVFVGVQILYAFRIARIVKSKFHYNYYIGGSVLIASLILMIEDTNSLMAMVIFYGILFVVNIMHLLSIHDKERQRHKLFIIGFVLFLVCDINVLFFNILPKYGISNLLYEFTRVSMWLFYLPAQVLLSLSGVLENQEYRLR